MIQISIDYKKIQTIKQNIIKLLIVKRAYKGYCSWLKQEQIEPLSFEEFSKFEFWKIELAFRQYFGWYKKQDFRKAKTSFKSIIFNKI